MSKKIIFLLLGMTCLSLFLTIYQRGVSPPSFNTDEAAFGYNAYSLLKTGKDEYGTPLPLRLKSFGDYKLPLYSYLSIPAIALFGLNENSIRIVNMVAMSLLPLSVFFLGRELFKKHNISLTASFLTAASLGLHVLARQAHEGLLAVFFITLSAIFFVRLLKHNRPREIIFFLLTLGLALFSYHASRIFAALFLAYTFFFFWKKTNGKKTIAIIAFFILLLLLPDAIYKPERVKNLFLFNSTGYTLRINELRAEGGTRFIYNKATLAIPTFINNYLIYLSPQFLAINGDENWRFGFSGMGPLTIIEYMMLFVGLYYLFKNKAPRRFFLLLFFLTAPLTSALSWAGMSLTRSITILIPLILIISYGYVEVIRATRLTLGLLIALLYFFFLFYNWDFYLFHYPKRATVIRSWQAGNRELGRFVRENYDRFDHFYITKRNGEPYIFLLFYLHYPPHEYQKQANLSAPDEFGFGQVEKFDKFDFKFNFNSAMRKTVFIGYPEDFPDSITKEQVKIMKVGSEEIFWIYETK